MITCFSKYINLFTKEIHKRTKHLCTASRNWCRLASGEAMLWTLGTTSIPWSSPRKISPAILESIQSCAESLLPERRLDTCVYRWIGRGELCHWPDKSSRNRGQFREVCLLVSSCMFLALGCTRIGIREQARNRRRSRGAFHIYIVECVWGRYMQVPLSYWRLSTRERSCPDRADWGLESRLRLMHM